jgi:hypothetical protein
MLVSLLAPIILSAVALFFASFLSWMVLQLHKNDWKKLPNEDATLAALKPLEPSPGNYMFPTCENPKDHQTPEFQARWAAGPRGVVTFFSNEGMGAKLGQTFVYFLVVSFCLAYLATIVIPAGASFRHVFRFMSTAAFLTFFAAIVPHAIWFKVRIVGHLIESIAYAAIVGAIFAAMWPAAA